MISSLKRVAAPGLLAFAVAAILSIGPASSAEDLWANVQKSGVIRAGAGLAPPDVIRDPKTGEYSGIFVDLLRDFAKTQLEGVKVEFVDTDWDNMIAGLNGSKWDVAMAINRKPKRAMVIHFSQSARFFEVNFVYNKDNPKLGSPGDFGVNFDKPGVTFAVVSGTAEDDALTGRVKQAKIMRLPNYDDVRLAVKSRRADVSVADTVTNQLFINANKDWAVAALPVPALARQGIAYGFRKDVPQDVIDALDIYLEQKTAEGEVERLTAKYLAPSPAN